MFKKLMLTAIAACVGLAVSGDAYSQYCGGTVMHSGDCGNNSRGYVASCCPSGYRVQGVAYNDSARGNDQVDRADAVSAVCRSISKGNIMMPSDFQTPPVNFMCEPKEVLAGITCKDLKGDDALDGCTAICQTPGSTVLRTISNPDLDSNYKQHMQDQHTVYLPQRVVGIAYKDLDKGSSDRADCATIIVK